VVWFSTLGHIMRAAYFIRLALVLGAAACFVIGAKMIAQDIVYHVNHDPLDLFFTIFPFIPIILIAPRYKNRKVIYHIIGAAEVIIVVINYFLVLR